MICFKAYYIWMTIASTMISWQGSFKNWRKFICIGLNLWWNLTLFYLSFSIKLLNQLIIISLYQRQLNIFPLLIFSIESLRPSIIGLPDFSIANSFANLILYSYLKSALYFFHSYCSFLKHIYGKLLVFMSFRKKFLFHALVNKSYILRQHFSIWHIRVFKGPNVLSLWLVRLLFKSLKFFLLHFKLVLPY